MIATTNDADGSAGAGRCPAAEAEDLGHVLRLMRLLLTAVDYAGTDGLTLERDSALVGLVRTLVGRQGTSPHSTRTAVMALRDLVWRVDTARALLSARVDEAGRRELDVLLDTDDIHLFLRQER
ncbi:hypothetical protein [Oharaeibacter diazotrophicus]|uniref:Uncharacterized protein n=1 Tax=Oharaeibacter diazotrophicus TaxID=1920512 RepID=A0A4R6RLN4_9HYPH|nr:hypothetical protein [Oharaeibacter diazotrophicus]TDP87444.1 hypothetical protein EDD54_1339 [Oharaeibacter diazotrophicus]BBE70612.1 hypothetical protein OHA_1_00176 [Pleomorphomonas sp. SM30]GLS77358.1 hypothetical protein GCM10007904_26950 [Oharaeibacter diazotrophicus]